MAGETVGLAGAGFLGACYDTGQRGTPPPMTDMDIIFESAEQTAVLATVDAHRSGTIEVDVRIPIDARPGEATITVGPAAARPLVVDSP